MESAEEIRASNPKLSGINYMLPGALDPDDCYTFILMDPEEASLKKERRPVHTESSLCDVCRSSLEYFAYRVELSKSRGTKKDPKADPKADDFGLRDVVSHHQGLQSMWENMASGCHLCSLLVPLVRGPADTAEAEEFFTNAKAEMAWNLNVDDDHGGLKRGRLQFALMDSRLDRTWSNYHVFARLQLWPATEYARLFQDVIAQDASVGSSTDLGDDESSLSASSISNPSVSDSSFSNRHSSEDLSSNGSPLPEAESVSPSSSWGPGSSFSDSQSSRDQTSWTSPSYGSSRSSSLIDGDHRLDDRVWLEANSTNSSYSRTLAIEWLSECHKNEDGCHAECNEIVDDWLPTRLIDVRQAFENKVLRLVSPKESSELFVADTKYATLSHCWGEWGPKAMPVLTAANERERFEEGINLAVVPLTFQHAVEVASWFQIPWLWIDSLCIIQDSEADWRQEASQMHQVYKNGTLNIAADSAVDARKGLFRHRGTVAFMPLKLELPGAGETIYLTIDERNLFQWMKEAPLSDRAWVFQERHLSRRILHFTKHQIFWECCRNTPSFACETFPKGAPLRALFDDKPKMQAKGLLDGSVDSHSGLRDLWEDLCQMYSEKKLSHKEDKLVALLGLAKEFEELLPNDAYVAGMWRSSLPSSLLWQVEKGDAEGSPEKFLEIAPSWSWASINGALSKEFRHQPEGEAAVCSVVDVASDPFPDQRAGIADGKRIHLSLSGYLRKVTIHDNLAVDSVVPPTFNNKTKVVIHEDDEEFAITTFRSVYYTLDSGTKSRPIDAYFLFVMIRHEPQNMSLNGLLLQNHEKTNTCQRIGTLNISGRDSVAMRYKIKPGLNCNLPSAFESEPARQSLRTDVSDKDSGDEDRPNPKMAGPEALYAYDWKYNGTSFAKLTPTTIKLI
ncbi:MAG: hypothetical protein Q9220_001137 [cf. Caloplaca sp. 1 TL-2023]